VSSSVFVAAGILASRIIGLVRQRVFAHYFGLESDAADAWSAGFRIPNFRQNMFGEGALSASFIPVYAALLAQGEDEEANRVAGAVGTLLGLIVSVLVAIGVLATPLFIAAIAPGFQGDKRDLTIQVVRILFPGIGMLVMSAWCLGVLNSHRRFLLSYSAPVLSSAAIIATLLIFGPGSELPRLVVILALGAVVGSALQFAVQLPVVARVAPDVRLSFDYRNPHVAAVIRNFVPVMISRGVVQISAYVDTVIATLLPTGAPTAFFNATTLYTLPVSLFGMSVSAAELPAMSGIAATGDEALRARLNNGLRQIAFFIVPSAVAFVAFGDVVAGAVLQTGRFTRADSVRVWAILAGSAVGLLATTLGRLYSSAYFALRDTRTPLQYAMVRVVLTTALGYAFALPLPRALGVDPFWGTAGLTVSAGVAGWVEMLLLRSSLNTRIGATGLPFRYVAKLWSAALAGAALGWTIKLALHPAQPIVAGVLILIPFGLTYLAMTAALRIPETSTALSRLRRRR
jgi:putative peptidoglycan lipid II flippase